LDWTRTTENFVEFGLDPVCKSLEKLGPGPDLHRVIGKEMRHFCCEKAAFFKFLDFIWTWTLLLETFLDRGWTWTEFEKIWTGSGSRNMTVRSSLA